MMLLLICWLKHPSPHQIKWLDKEGTEIEANEKKKNIVDEEEEVEGTKLHNAVSTIKLKVTNLCIYAFRLASLLVYSH